MDDELSTLLVTYAKEHIQSAQFAEFLARKIVNQHSQVLLEEFEHLWQTQLSERVKGLLDKHIAELERSGEVKHRLAWAVVKEVNSQTWAQSDQPTEPNEN